MADSENSRFELGDRFIVEGANKWKEGYDVNGPTQYVGEKEIADAEIGCLFWCITERLYVIKATPTRVYACTDVVDGNWRSHVWKGRGDHRSLLRRSEEEEPNMRVIKDVIPKRKPAKKRVDERAVKVAAVFSVFKDRGNEQEVVDEVVTLENELEMNGYYGIWTSNGRTRDEPPSSTSLNDLQGFLSWFQSLTIEDRNKIDGIFIMLIAHGYTGLDGKPKLMLEGDSEEDNTFDVEAWIEEFVGTQFPVIICISSCRIEDDLSETTGGAFKVDKFKDPPKNIFISWASIEGKLANDGAFVDAWRVRIANDFLNKNINIVADAIHNAIRAGKPYSGLGYEKKCQAGIWKLEGALGPSNSIEENIKELIKRCTDFGIRKSGKQGESRAALEQMHKWKTEGVLQGKMIAVVEDGLIAVMCCHGEKKIRPWHLLLSRKLRN